MNPTETVIARTKKLIAEKKVTQYRLAMNSGITHATLSAFLLNKNKSVEFTTIFAIVKGFDITLKEFFDDPIFQNEDIEW